MLLLCELIGATYFFGSRSNSLNWRKFPGRFSYSLGTRLIQTECRVLYNTCSSLSKVVEYLVGDGPNNRFALICSECHSHNGMVLRDEFEYITFRCAYCYHLNPARKRKPSLLPPSSPSSGPPTTQLTENLEPSTTQDLVSA